MSARRDSVRDVQVEVPPDEAVELSGGRLDGVFRISYGSAAAALTT